MRAKEPNPIMLPIIMLIIAADDHAGDADGSLDEFQTLECAYLGF